MVGISPGIPSGDLVWGRVPPRRLHPSPELGKGGTLEAVEVALCTIRGSLGELSSHGVTGHAGRPVLMASEKVTKERDSLQCQLEEQGDELRDVLKKEPKLLRAEMALLRHISGTGGGSRKMCSARGRGGDEGRSGAFSPEDGRGDVRRGGGDVADI